MYHVEFVNEQLGNVVAVEAGAALDKCVELVARRRSLNTTWSGDFIDKTLFVMVTEEKKGEKENRQKG